MKLSANSFMVEFTPRCTCGEVPVRENVARTNIHTKEIEEKRRKKLERSTTAIFSSPLLLRMPDSH